MIAPRLSAIVRRMKVMTGTTHMGEILKIKRSQLKRLETLADELQAVRFPIPAAANPNLLASLAGRSPRLDFFDKFSGKRDNYEFKHVQPPPSIYFTGHNWQALNAELCVAFGGTSSATADAVWLTILLAQVVAKSGGTVISGGAVGIDTQAHMAALDVGGPTVAVLGKPVKGGLDHAHEAPRSYFEKGILATGGLASEYAKDAGALGKRVLSRDRIITGLADAFVAVECGYDKATVDAAKRAFIQGRAVFAVQWDFISQQWHKPEAAGNVQLFREMIAHPIPSRPTRTLKEVGEEFRRVLTELDRYREPPNKRMEPRSGTGKRAAHS